MQKAALASVLVRFGLSIRAATSSGRSISRKEIDSFESVTDFVRNSGILAELHGVAAGEHLDALVQFAGSFVRTSPSNFRRNHQEKREPTAECRPTLHIYAHESKNSVISHHTTNCLS